MTSPELGPSEFGPPTGATPDLGPGEVHLWSVDLAASGEHLSAHRRLLSDEERERADRFHFDRHRRRYTVAWAAVRRLLGAYGRQASPLELTYGPKGKPSLLHEPELEFNLSHSGDRALVALSRSGAVGIDVELVRALEDADDIARRFFSRREVESYLAQEEAVRPRAFFNCWTRKEAFVKALGEGLFLELDRFDVSLAPGEPARILAVEGSEADAREWSLLSLEPATGFVGALATRWKPRVVRAFSSGPALEGLPPRRRHAAEL